jgi:hypothetical protein
MEARYNLKLMALRNKNRIKKMRASKVNSDIETEYYAMLKNIIEYIKQKFVKVAAEGMSKPRIKEQWQDASYTTRMEELIAQVLKSIENRYDDKTLIELIKRLISKTDKSQFSNFKTSADYGFGFDISKMPEFKSYKQFINATINKNLLVVRNLREETFYKLEMSLRTAIQNGTSTKQLTQQLEQIGQHTKKRCALIARNEIKNVTRELSQRREQNAGFEVYEWVTAEDERVRGNPNGLYPKTKPSHFIMNGLYCRYDDDSVYSSDQGKTWKKRTAKMDKGKPGQEINCFLPNTPISFISNPLKIYKRFYTGLIVKITDETGVSISVTPNHPILTSRGWVFAKDIKHSDKLIKSLDSYSISSFRTNINNSHIIFTNNIYNLFKIIFASKRVIGTNVKFHGDVTNNKVEIIDIKNKLPNRIKSFFFKKIIDKIFASSNFTKRSLFANSSFSNFFDTVISCSGRQMSFLDLVSPLFSGHSVPLVKFSFALISDFNIAFSQYSSNNISASLKLFRDLIFAYARSIKTTDLNNIKVYSLNGLPFVETGINTISHENISSNVYNFETEDSLYLCNGIVNHNCRCVQIPV